MSSRIFRAVFFSTILTLLLGCVLILGVLYPYFTGLQEKQLETVLHLSARGVEQGGLGYFTGLEENCRLTWIGADGTVLYDSENRWNEMENHAQREEIREAFATGSGSSVRHSATRMEKTIYRAERLPDGTVLRSSVSCAGAMMLVLGLLQPAAVILFAAMVVALVLARAISSKLLRPLNALDLDALPDSPPYEELAPLLQKIKLQQRELAVRARELSDRKRQMEFAEQNRREFTANVSHELKTPLQTILGSAELLENGLVQPVDVPVFTGRIRSEAQRLLALIQDIFHLSRLDEGMQPELELVELSQLAGEETEHLRRKAEEQGIRLHFQGEQVMVRAVPQLVREIVHNLCDNAIQYNRPGGTVTVRVEEGQRQVLLSVSDTGIGIPQEEQPRVFERFYRVDKSRSKQTGGTGLGLSIVKNAASYLQAELQLESVPNVGTTVTLRFPRAE